NCWRELRSQSDHDRTLEGLPGPSTASRGDRGCRKERRQEAASEPHGDEEAGPAGALEQFEEAAARAQRVAPLAAKALTTFPPSLRPRPRPAGHYRRPRTPSPGGYRSARSR